MNSAAEFWEEFGEFGLDSNDEPMRCTVETLTGQGALGPKFAPPVERPGLPQFYDVRLVRVSGGSEVTASTTIYAPRDMAGDFAVGSRVTLADGRQTVVLTLGTPDMGVILSFIKVALE